MTESSTSSPRPLYIDTCLPSAIVKGELSSGDSQALVTISGLVQTSELTLCTATVMKEEMERIPEPYRGPHLEAYEALRTVTGFPTTTWIDEDPKSPTFNEPTMHPQFEALLQIVPDTNDARHLFQAHMNGVPDFITIDEKTILSHATEIRAAVGVTVWSPSDFVSNVTSRST
jgi:hypothetical protein